MESLWNRAKFQQSLKCQSYYATVRFAPKRSLRCQSPGKLPLSRVRFVALGLHGWWVMTEDKQAAIRAAAALLKWLERPGDDRELDLRYKLETLVLALDRRSGEEQS